MRMRALVTLLVLVGGAGGCALDSPPRTEETDKVAGIIALAIGSPRQDDAVGYARAANATRGARDGRLTVVGVSRRHIVLRVHLDAYDVTTFPSHSEPEVWTCYDVPVSRYGTVGSPSRRACPADTTPVRLPPPPPVMEIPGAADGVVRAGLRRTSSGADAVDAFVRHRLRAPRRGALPPEVMVADDGADTGVAVRGEDTCLLGSRVDGEVLVWSPSRVQLQPGELSCDPQTALGRAGISPPH